MKSRVFILFFLLVAICSCGKKSSDYDKGYEAAWDESDKPNWFSSKEYREGYEQGIDDADAYDSGYYDGFNKKKCTYPKDRDYMDGYKDGSSARKRRGW